MQTYGAEIVVFTYTLTTPLRRCQTHLVPEDGHFLSVDGWSSVWSCVVLDSSNTRTKQSSCKLCYMLLAYWLAEG